jgi:predicted SprT family Zn-dependent metalloprotease
MYDLNKIEARCKELSATVGDTFDIPVQLNGRLTRTLGRVHQEKRNGKWHSVKMEISKALLATATDESVCSVIDHEWAHYYVTKLTGESHGHDAEFKKVCAMIGCSNDGVVTKVERTVADEKISKYVVYCPTCGEAIGYFSRMCSTLQHIDECTCKRCNGGNLYYVQNW